jgi:hypothetical protein
MNHAQSPKNKGIIDFPVLIFLYFCGEGKKRRKVKAKVEAGGFRKLVLGAHKY